MVDFNKEYDRILKLMQTVMPSLRYFEIDFENSILVIHSDDNEEYFYIKENKFEEYLSLRLLRFQLMIDMKKATNEEDIMMLAHLNNMMVALSVSMYRRKSEVKETNNEKNNSHYYH